ncbi:hypothetical protein [uncultured Maribacter sp.]|uniref:hypothetical protein n=1 Tax=uncultured Maribacter sp. TaxID=431308 RepID=UPI0026381378|nr:hypothetical protein [uncultured Maribacter sp.]
MESISNTPSTSNILINSITGLLLVIAIAFIIAAIPSATNYQWIVFFFLAATPFQAIVGILWQNNLPFIKGLDKIHQTTKGIILVIFTMLFGLLIGGLTLLIMGKGTGILTPQLNHFLITSIIITLWLIIIVNFWPFIGKIKNITIVGFCTLILAFGIAFIVWKIFFNYESISNLVPWYVESLDPKGVFDFSTTIVYIITCCPVLLYLALFDDWFLEKWSGAIQPGKAILNTNIILGISYIFQFFFTKVIGMDVMVYMVMVPISMVFGVFLVNNSTQFFLFKNIRQPLKGIYKMIAATIFGLSMYVLYFNMGAWITGQEMASGANGNYQLDLWVADTMLGISFPLIIVITGYFNYWPLKSKIK